MASNSVRIHQELFDSASIDVKTNLRSITRAKIELNALANPDLPVDIVRDLIIAKEEQSEAFSLDD